jgi:predicted O-methyltransferase YrrM
MRELLQRFGLRKPEEPQTKGLPEAQPREIIASIGEPFVSVLCSMYRNEPQVGAEGKTYAIDAITRIGPQQGMLIYQLVCDAKPDNTLEIGLAFGFSSVYFLAAIKANGKGHHVALDPYQYEKWNGVGAAREKVLGIEAGIFEFIRENSIQGLALLGKQQRRFGTILIDGDHKFDGALLDFKVAASLCEPGGHIILDDMWMASIQKVASFIRLNRPDFAEAPTATENMTVFKKIGDDKRRWDDFVPF